jgi:hypothetical protein
MTNAELILTAQNGQNSREMKVDGTEEEVLAADQVIDGRL